MTPSAPETYSVPLPESKCEQRKKFGHHITMGGWSRNLSLNIECIKKFGKSQFQEAFEKESKGIPL